MAKREEFATQQPHLETHRLVFLDEAGFRLGTPPHYSWSPLGKKAFGKVPGSWDTLTMIGAIALDGFRGFMTIDAATDADVFRAFVKNELVKQLRRNDILVMDNLSVHKDVAVRAMLDQAGVTVIFLPPYSPEYNPIEKVWSKLKDILRRADTMAREAFDSAVAVAMKSITPENIRAWVQYAGYKIDST